MGFSTRTSVRMAVVTAPVDTQPPATEPGAPRSGVGTWTLVAFGLGGLFFLAIAVLAISLGDDDGSRPGPMWSGRVLEPAPERPTTNLIDTSGAPFDLRSATAGQLTLVFFGYTNCPDICSIQMATLKQSLDRVEVPAKVVFITTDPDRDTPERLRTWLDSFDPSFIGATGTPEAIAQAQDDLGVTVAVADAPNDDGSYLVGHSSAVYVITPDDHAHLAYPAGTRQENWANDLPRIADEAAWQAGAG
jgi:protein SCO1/2